MKNNPFSKKMNEAINEAGAALLVGEMLVLVASLATAAALLVYHDAHREELKGVSLKEHLTRKFK